VTGETANYCLKVNRLDIDAPFGITPKLSCSIALPYSSRASAADIAASKVGGGSRAGQR
jgi:hypothetical protein